jgi:hypothetical protein
MRPLQLFMNSYRDARIHGLSDEIMVSRALLPILHWWAHVPKPTRGLPWKSPKPSVTLNTYTSLEAWGAYMQNQKVQGKWSKEQASCHINVLEMLPVLKALEAYQLMNRSVLVHTDNTTVLSFINKARGTKFPRLCLLTWEMFTWCMANQVTLQAMHIPGERNLLTDKLSRHMSSPTEWELNNKVVQELFLIWATLDIDLFATYETEIFFSFAPCFPIRRQCIKMHWQSVGTTCSHTHTPHWQVFHKNSQRQGHGATDSSDMDSQGVVPSPARSLSPFSLSPSSNEEFSDSGQRVLNTPQPHRALSRGLAAKHRSLSARRLSEQAADTCISDKSTSTHRAYQSSLCLVWKE